MYFFVPPKENCATYSAQLVCVCVCDFALNRSNELLVSTFFLKCLGWRWQLHPQQPWCKIWWKSKEKNNRYFKKMAMLFGFAPSAKNNDFTGKTYRNRAIHPRSYALTRAHTHTHKHEPSLWMAQITLGDIKCKERTVNNTVHQAKLTEIGQFTLDHMRAHKNKHTHTHKHTHKLCTVDGAIHIGKHKIHTTSWKTIKCNRENSSKFGTSP